MAKTTFRDKCIKTFTLFKKRTEALAKKMPTGTASAQAKLVMDALADMVTACASLPDKTTKAAPTFAVGGNVRIKVKARPQYDFLLTEREMEGALVVAAVSPDGANVHVKTENETVMFVPKKFLEVVDKSIFLASNPDLA